MSDFIARLRAVARKYGMAYDDIDAIEEAVALVEAVEAAPVADISEDGKHDGRSALLNAAIAAGYYKGQRVRVLAVGEDG